MPSLIVRGMDLISYETASRIIEGMVEDMGLKDFSEKGNIESHYRKVLAKDMNDRARDKLGVYN
jgi:hypothetical protein